MAGQRGVETSLGAASRPAPGLGDLFYKSFGIACLRRRSKLYFPEEEICSKVDHDSDSSNVVEVYFIRGVSGKFLDSIRHCSKNRVGLPANVNG